MAASSSPSAHTEIGLAAERRFFAWLSLAILFATVLGFARSYLLVPIRGRPVETLPPTLLVHLHASICFAWCLLLVVQSFLVVRGRILNHRRLGYLGLGLFVGMVGTGPLVAIKSVIRQGSPVEEMSFLAVSLGNVLAYTLLLGAAFIWRRQVAAHKRLMMLGMVALLSAPFGRLIDLPYLLPHVVGPGLVVLALVIWDYRVHGAAHPVTQWAGPGILLWELAPNLYMHSEPWLKFSRMLVGLAS